MTSIAELRSPADQRRPLLARPFEALGRRVLDLTLQQLRGGRLEIVEADTTRAYGDPAAPPIRLEVLDPGFYAAVGFGGSIGAAEAFVDELWRVDDLAGLIELLAANEDALGAVEGPIARLAAPLTRFAYWLQRNTRSGSRRNIRAHYDLGDEFFALFLDPTLTYSSAIFERGAATLEEAQREKIDRACRKLALDRSDHLLEIGTGWGALAIHAAGNYGCRVTTTTISPKQFEAARRRVGEAGLQDRVEVVQRDYRDLDGQFDKLVSIEMVEAVGAKFLPEYFRCCSRLLRPDGMMLLQAILIRDQHYALAARTRDFLKAYIFPGSCLPSLSVIGDALRRETDLAVFHYEEIGVHYAETLRHWREAFAARADEVRALGFDDRFRRLWEFYLCYCEGTFRARRVGAAQLLLTKPGTRREPWGRSEPAAESRAR